MPRPVPKGRSDVTQPVLHHRLPADDKEISLTFGKGLSVMMAFEGARADLTIGEISEKIGLNRAVARRLVRTLEQLGFVVQDRGRYRLTPRVLGLTRGFMESHSIPRVVQPVLRAASIEIGESVSFAMRDGEEAVYVAHAFVPSRFTLNMVTVGSSAPLLPTAVGRVILAFLPQAQLDQILLQAEQVRYTDQTQTDPAVLRAQLREISLRGFAWLQSEYVEGVASLAVPVFDPQRRIIGAVSIIFPSGHYPATQVETEFVRHLQHCAEAVGSVF